MPQMMPLSWLILFLLFSITFLLFNFMNYYSYLPLPSQNIKKKMIFYSMTWKW